MDFPTRLKALRIEKGLSQEDLGNMVDLKSQTISHYETGYRSPTTYSLSRLCDVFNVTSDYLLGRSEYRQYPSADIHTVARCLIKEIQEAVCKAEGRLREF